MIIPFAALEKQGRPSKVRGFIQVSKNMEDSSLCPVLALVTYLNHVSFA